MAAHSEPIGSFDEGHQVALQGGARQGHGGRGGGRGRLQFQPPFGRGRSRICLIFHYFQKLECRNVVPRRPSHGSRPSSFSNGLFRFSTSFDKNPHFPEEAIKALQVFNFVSFCSLYCGLNIAGIRWPVPGRVREGRNERPREWINCSLGHGFTKTLREQPKGVGSDTGSKEHGFCA